MVLEVSLTLAVYIMFQSQLVINSTSKYHIFVFITCPCVWEQIKHSTNQIVHVYNAPRRLLG